jgi:hypothetical protein
MLYFNKILNREEISLYRAVFDFSINRITLKVLYDTFKSKIFSSKDSFDESLKTDKNIFCISYISISDTLENLTKTCLELKKYITKLNKNIDVDVEITDTDYSIRTMSRQNDVGDLSKTTNVKNYLMWKGFTINDKTHALLIAKHENATETLHTIFTFYDIYFQPDLQPRQMLDCPEFYKMKDDESITVNNIDYFETHLMKGTYFDLLPSHLQKYIFLMVTPSYKIEKFDDIYAINDTNFLQWDEMEGMTTNLIPIKP